MYVCLMSVSERMSVTREMSIWHLLECKATNRLEAVLSISRLEAEGFARDAPVDFWPSVVCSLSVS